MRAILFVLAFVGFAQTAPAQSMTEDQIKQLALEAILENPDIIMQAVAILQQREQGTGGLWRQYCAFAA